MSVYQFTQFCSLTKISIAIRAEFVYNVAIRVSAPNGSIAFPKGVKNNNVYR